MSANAEARQGQHVELPRPRAGGRSFWRDCALVGLASALLLLALAPFFDPSRLHVNGLGRVFNDQVGYVSVARNLVEHGELDNHLVYPSILGQPGTRSYLYMPGHFVALALSYWTFGFGDFQSILPSLVAFVLASIAVFGLGCTLYGRLIGLLAAGLFCALPVNVVFAFSAMSEMTLVAAAAIALFAFARLPSRAKPWCGPLLLALPFVFRETGAFLCIPMAALLSADQRAKERGRLLVFALGSLVVLFLVYRADFSFQRPSLLFANLIRTNESSQYGDAFASVFNAHAPGEWLSALSFNFDLNVLRLLDAFETRPHYLEWSTLLLFVAAAVLAIVGGFRARPKDAFALSSGALGAAMLLFALLLHRVDGFRGPRLMMMVAPCACVAVVATLLPHVRGGSKVALSKRQAGAFVALVLGGIATAAAMGGSMAAFDASDDRDTRLLEAIGHDDSKLLVTPDSIGLDYALRHPRARWSFPPINDRTMALVQERFPIGTLIIPRYMYGPVLSEAAIADASLTPVERFQYGPEDLMVLKNVNDWRKAAAERARDIDISRCPPSKETSGGTLDSLAETADGFRLAGWTAVPELGRVPGELWIVAGDKVVAVVDRFFRRRDVAGSLGSKVYALCGFEVWLPKSVLPRRDNVVRVVAHDVTTNRCFELTRGPNVPASMRGTGDK